MKFEERLQQKIGRDAGFRVPDDYFEQTFDKIAASLPERKPATPVRLTPWQRMRPYVYLAAMFAGIWCMMKMFHIMQNPPEVSLDNPPSAVAAAMQTATTDELVLSLMSEESEFESDYELENSLANDYGSFADFEKDFRNTVATDYAEADAESEEFSDDSMAMY